METEHDESGAGEEAAPPPVPAPTPTSLSLPVPSSILAPPVPTIPIYHLQQTAPDAISSLLTTGHDDENENEMNNSDGGGGGEYMNGNMLNVDTCLALNSNNRTLDWSNSLFRPVSRFSMTNRRECKSTSDEASTFEVNALAIDPAPTSSPFMSNDYDKSSLMPLHAISPARYQPTHHLRPRIPHHSHGHGHHANLRFLDMVKQKPKPVTNSPSPTVASAAAAGPSWSLSNAKSFYGQFGLNPSLFNLSRVKGSSSATRETVQINSTCHVTTNKFHRMGASTSSSMKERKFVKRLSSSNKFGIESLNKKHGDCKLPGLGGALLDCLLFFKKISTDFSNSTDNYNKKLFHAVLNEDAKAGKLVKPNKDDDWKRRVSFLNHDLRACSERPS